MNAANNSSKVFSYNNAKNFEPTHTTQWVIYSTSHANLNVLDGYCPITDYSFDYEVENESLMVSSRYNIETFKKRQMPKSLSLTFIDMGFNLCSFFEDYWKDQKNAIAFNEINGRGITFIIELYDKDKTTIKKYIITGFPTGNISVRGDQGYSLNTFPVNLTITSFSTM